jgi:hypothetical protein
MAFLGGSLLGIVEMVGVFISLVTGGCPLDSQEK